MKQLSFVILLCFVVKLSGAQGWLTNGNSGLTSSNFLGTTDNKTLFFRTNNIDRGKLQANGIWRFGLGGNNASIDTAGVLKFNGTGGYQVADDKYVFQNSSHTKYGLFFNGTIGQYEFRDSFANVVFSVNDHGNGTLTGALKIGAYTLPGIDGTNGQVLTTNGSGIVSWANASGGSGANTALSNLTTTSINKSLIPASDSAFDLGSKIKAWKNLFVDGKVGINVDPVSKLDIRAVGTSASTYSFRITNLLQLGLVNTLFSVRDDGRVGIGIANPSVSLDVLGDAQFNTGNTTDCDMRLKTANSDMGWFASGGRNSMALYNYASKQVLMRIFGDGSGNYAIGYGALSGNTTGTQNIAFGVNALKNNKTGSYNTAIGDAAGENIDAWSSFGISDKFNTFLGSAADRAASLALSTVNNSTAIGFGTTIEADNFIRIGNVNVTAIGGSVSWTTYTGGGFKNNIKENVKGLAFINKLKPITYTVDVDKLNKYYYEKRGKDSAYKRMMIDLKSSTDKASQIVYSGFDAQEVEAVAKNVNYDFSGIDKPKNKDGLYGLRYSDFVVPLVKAVQELSVANDMKDAKITEQDKKIDSQQKQIDELRSMMLQLQQNFNNCNPCGQQSSMRNELPVMSGASLAQNIPNPFNHTTTINYSLPQQYTSAKIIVVDKMGRVLKDVRVSGNGKGSLQIDASTLSSGAYNYSLFVDGKLIDTKQMERLK